MPYVEGRTIHDADSHIMETPNWLDPFLERKVRERMPRRRLSALKPGEHRLIDKARADHGNASYRVLDEDEILTRKNWNATGSFGGITGV